MVKPQSLGIGVYLKLLICSQNSNKTDKGEGSGHAKMVVTMGLYRGCFQMSYNLILMSFIFGKPSRQTKTGMHSQKALFLDRSPPSNLLTHSTEINRIARNSVVPNCQQQPANHSQKLTTSESGFPNFLASKRKQALCNNPLLASNRSGLGGNLSPTKKRDQQIQISNEQSSEYFNSTEILSDRRPRQLETLKNASNQFKVLAPPMLLRTRRNHKKPHEHLTFSDNYGRVLQGLKAANTKAIQEKNSVNQFDSLSEASSTSLEGMKQFQNYKISQDSNKKPSASPILKERSHDHKLMSSIQLEKVSCFSPKATKPVHANLKNLTSGQQTVASNTKFRSPQARNSFKGYPEYESPLVTQRTASKQDNKQTNFSPIKIYISPDQKQNTKPNTFIPSPPTIKKPSPNNSPQFILFNPISNNKHKVEIFQNIRLLANNGGNCVYLVREKVSKFIFCLKKCMISSGCEMRSSYHEELKISQNTDVSVTDNAAQNLLLNGLIREAKISQYIDHPNLVKTFCCLVDKDNVYHLMQYLQGPTLQLQIQRQFFDSQRPWSPSYKSSPSSRIQQIRNILQQLLRAVSHLHERGIIHRDIKPANIFISHKNIIKLGDFGISIYSQPFDYYGTLDYASPEMIMHKKYDRSVDMWAIGCVAFELFVGRPPFFNENEKTTTQNLVSCHYDSSLVSHEKLRHLISELLQKNPQNRLTCSQALAHPFFTSSSKMVA